MRKQTLPTFGDPYTNVYHEWCYANQREARDPAHVQLFRHTSNGVR